MRLKMSNYRYTVRKNHTLVSRDKMEKSTMTVTLQVVERSMPWSGRAKIHTSYFSELSIDRLDKIEVLTLDGACLSLIAFADSHIPLDQIRICAEDIIKLGISEDDQVIVRKKDPICE